MSLSPGNPARESHLPRIETLTLDVLGELSRVERAVNDIHDKLFGPRPEEAPSTAHVTSEPPGFFDRHEHQLEAAQRILRGVTADLAAIGSDLGIAMTEAPPLRAHGR